MRRYVSADELNELVVAVHGEPVFLKDVATRGRRAGRADELRPPYGWGAARGFETHEGFPGTLIGATGWGGFRGNQTGGDHRARQEERHQRGNRRTRDPGGHRAAQAELVPDDVEVVITRNYGLTADDKVNELIEALGVAIIIVIALLDHRLGWREG
jgi:hypothetical protein